MKVVTPEISWHAKEAIYAIDVQPKRASNGIARAVTAGIDCNIRVWSLVEKDEKTTVRFLSNLSRHEKPVNIVRFSNQGTVLASGGDDATIILWKLSDKDEPPNLFASEEDGKNIESWTAFKMLRGHLEDVTDLCWSSDDQFVVSGSIDYTAIVWSIEKGVKLSILSEAKHFIHGVAWDPSNDYISVMSCDRSLRLYNVTSRRCIRNISRIVYPPVGQEEDSNDENITVKSQRIFHDESVVRRRLTFSPDGKLLIVPAGCLNVPDGDNTKQVNTVYIFTHNKINKPAAFLTGLNDPATVIKVCKCPFELRGSDKPYVELNYRWVFAVATSDTILLYDTEQIPPFAKLVNLHYASITDLAWDDEGTYLLVSSRDGFCSIVHFEENEIGTKYKLPLALSKTEHVLKNGTKDTEEINITSSNKSKDKMETNSPPKADELPVFSEPEKDPLSTIEKMITNKTEDVINISDSEDSCSAPAKENSKENAKTNETVAPKRRVQLETVTANKPSPTKPDQIKSDSTKRRIQITTVDVHSSPPSKHFEKAKEKAIILDSPDSKIVPSNVNVNATKSRRVAFTTLD